jgi:hypothetical protein
VNWLAPWRRWAGEQCPAIEPVTQARCTMMAGHDRRRNGVPPDRRRLHYARSQDDEGTVDVMWTEAKEMRRLLGLS